ncbi:MAG: hypothetical protein ABIA91_03205 [Patescibacteria group bacterium]
MIKNNQTTIQSIKINNKVIADFCYKKNDNSIEPYIKGFTKQYKELIKFFNKQPLKITINFVYTRKEMNKHWGVKSRKRLCAMVDNDNVYVIYIFSPLVFEKLTIYKQTEILPTIIHETAHTFVTEINKKSFAWMNEGICQYLEKQNNQDNVIKKKNWEWFIENNIFFDPDIKWSKQVEYDGYKISYNLVNYILKTKGKNKFIKLLKIRREGGLEELKQKMNKVVGDMDLLLNKFSQKLKLVNKAKMELN